MNPNTLTAQQQQLISKWGKIYDGAEKALNWIEEVRPNAPRLDAEADAFNLKLYRARNLAKSLKRVAGTPMTVGFFGLSQAGKSYLISALAADESGELETDIGGGSRLNFIDHFNPIGSGKEATGLVTRFTCQGSTVEDANYPLELRLFNEIEVAMILANSWFEDFDQERIDFEITEELIAQTLAPFDDLVCSSPVPGIIAEDIVALADYLRNNYRSSVSKLEANYWPRLIKIAPYLSISQRAQVLSIVWGQQGLISQTYVQLVGALHQLGLPEKIFAPINVLVQNKDGKLVQTNSIMNVNTLSMLMTARDIPLQVRPLKNGQLGNPTQILTGQLTALTTELVFPLANPPKDAIVEQVDLLDFPGYRTRQKLLKIEDAVESGDEASPVSRLILRGKVAYLFERYTTFQEMNALVMCTSSFKQSEVVTVGPVLSQWISKTQGANPEERKGRNGLIWALTMMDGFITNALNLKKEQMAESCENMIGLTMIERFGNFDWMKEWSPNQPFNNTFLVRKPRLQTPFIQLDEEENETGIIDQFSGKLADLRETIINTDPVKAHVAQIDQAWDAMLGLNDGGITRFSSSFTGIANLDFKLSRINQQWEQWHESVTSGLKRWYQEDGDAALGEKKETAQLILQNLGPQSASIGELMNYLAISDDTLRNLYLSGVYEDDSNDGEDEEGAKPAASAPNFYGNDSGFDFGNIFSNEPAPVAENQTRKINSHEHRFAKAVFSAWVKHLRELSERQQVLDILRLSREAITALTDEIITASYRYELQEKLTEALLAHTQTGTRREQTVEKQVLTTQIILQDYIAWLGNLSLAKDQRPVRMQNQPGHVFDYYDTEGPTDLPQLGEKPEDPSRRYLFDWFTAIVDITLNNAGHSQGREISLEQNNALGSVLEIFEG